MSGTAPGAQSAWVEANSYLDELGVDSMKSLKPSLHRIEAMCELLDHPERRIPAIHIAGTNGKTSTARIATSLLNAAGLSVGTFTSPHLSTVRERIARDRTAIDEHSFGDLFHHVRSFLHLAETRLGEPLSYFEVLTAMFFLWATETPVDAVVVEVGLGGRWDATNVVPAPCGVLTSVALDHTELLGGDRTEIAREKTGIAKPDAAFVCGERDPQLQGAVAETISAAGADGSFIGRDYELLTSAVAVDGRSLSIRTSRTQYDDLFLPLHGNHQALNAATAVEAVTRFLPARALEFDLVQQGLAAVTVPGRLESVRQGGTRVVLDVAHNPDGISALVNALGESFALQRVFVVAGFLRDKDYESMLLELARIATHLIATAPDTARALPVADVERAAAAVGLDVTSSTPVAAALDSAVALAGPGDLVCVTGSHYVVGEARAYLLEQAPVNS